MLIVLIRPEKRNHPKVDTHILAASKTASLVESSASFSFSSSVFASCRPFPTAAPWYPCTGLATDTVRGVGPTHKENTTGFHDIEIGSCLVNSTEDCADTERSDGGIQGIHLGILSQTLRYILRRDKLTIVRVSRDDAILP